MNYKKIITLAVCFIACICAWVLQSIASYPATKVIAFQSPLQHNAKSVLLFRNFYVDAATCLRKNKLARVVVLGNETTDRMFCDSLTQTLQTFYGGSGTGLFSPLQYNDQSKNINLQFSDNWNIAHTQAGVFAHYASFTGRQRSFNFTDDPEAWITWDAQKCKTKKLRLRFFLTNTDESASVIWSSRKHQLTEQFLVARSNMQLIDTLLADFKEGQLTFSATHPPALAAIALEEERGISSAILSWTNHRNDRLFAKNIRQQTTLLNTSLFLFPVEEKNLDHVLFLKNQLDLAKQYLYGKAIVIVLIAENENRFKKKSAFIHEAQKLIRDYGLCSFRCERRNYASGKAGVELAHLLRTDHRNMYLRYLSDK